MGEKEKKEATWQDKVKAAQTIMGALEQMGGTDKDRLGVLVMAATLSVPSNQFELLSKPF